MGRSLLWTFWVALHAMNFSGIARAQETDEQHWEKLIDARKIEEART